MNIARLITRASIISGLILTNTMWNSNSARSQTCIVTDSGETVCGKPSKSRPSNNAKPTTEIRETIDNFLVVFKGCRRSGTGVLCTYTIRNKGGGDNVLKMYTITGKIFEPSGKLNYATILNVAGKSTTNSTNVVIEPGIDYTVKVGFPNISEDVNTIVKLYLPFDLSQSLYYQNISISN